MIPRPGVAPTAIALSWRLALVVAAVYAVFVVSTVPLMELPSLVRAPTSAKPSQAGETAGDASVVASGSYPDIAKHPLFYPSRTPWKPPPPPAPPPVSRKPSPLTDYALVGVIVSGDVRSALIKPKGASKTIILGVGQELQGWTLKEITRERLHFAAGDAGYDMNFSKPSEVRR